MITKKKYEKALKELARIKRDFENNVNVSLEDYHRVGSFKEIKRTYESYNLK